MKVCGASGILRLREVLRHIQKNPHKKTHQLRLSGPSAATASSAAILPAASPATSPATADPSSNPWANLAPRPQAATSPSTTCSSSPSATPTSSTTSSTSSTPTPPSPPIMRPGTRWHQMRRWTLHPSPRSSTVMSLTSKLSGKCMDHHAPATQSWPVESEGLGVTQEGFLSQSPRLFARLQEMTPASRATRGSTMNTCTAGPKRQCLSLSRQKRSYKYVALSRWCTRTWLGSSCGPQSWYMRCSDGGQEEGEAEASGCEEEGQKSTQMSAESREMRNACIWPCTHTVSMAWVSSLVSPWVSCLCPGQYLRTLIRRHSTTCSSRSKMEPF